MTQALNLFEPNCRACDLCFKAQSVCIPGRRFDNQLLLPEYRPKIMMVGEAPGPTEDRQNSCFVGRAGEKLEEWVQHLDIPRDWIYVSNVVKCFPRHGDSYRAPTEDEVHACSAFYLENEIMLFQPEWIIPMGNSALNFFTGYQQISRFRGKESSVTIPSDRWLEMMVASGHSREELPKQQPYRIFPTYHPAATLYQPQLESKVLQDLGFLSDQVKGTSSVPWEKYKIIWTKEAFDASIDQLEQEILSGKCKKLCVDVETGGPKYLPDGTINEDEKKYGKGGLDPWDPANLLLCFSLTPYPESAHVIPYLHPESPWVDDSIMLMYIRRRLSKLLLMVGTFGHNYKFDLKWLLTRGFKIGEIHGDTFLKSWNIHNGSIFHDLEGLASRYTDLRSHKHRMQQHKLERGTRSFTFCDLQMVMEYCGSDTDADYRLDDVFSMIIETEGLERIAELTRQAIMPHVQLEINGCHIDCALIAHVEVVYVAELQALTEQFISWGYAARIEELAESKPGSFAVSSPTMLGILLKDCLMIDIDGILGKDGYTATGKIGTSKGVLSAYKEHYVQYTSEEYDQGTQDWCGHVVEVIDVVETFKKTQKHLSAYARNIPGHLKIDGLLHPHYGIRATETGRDTCREPAVHTIPWKSPVKMCFKSRWENIGGLILQGDYGQLEYRVLCCHCQDPKLIEIFNKGTDIHYEIAAAALNKLVEEITEEVRRRIKTVGFGTIYGRGPHSIAAQEKMAISEAKKFLADFFEGFPGILEWIQSQQALVIREGVVWSLHGHRRVIGDQYDTNEKFRRAQNTPIQSDASDLTLEAMIKIYEILKNSRFKSLQNSFVHDSLGYELYPGELIPLATMLQKQMQQGPARDHDWVTVPMLVDLELGYSWGAMCGLKLLGGTQIELDGTAENFNLVWGQISCWGVEIQPTVISMEEYFNKKEKKDYIKTVLDFPIAPHLQVVGA